MYYSYINNFKGKTHHSAVISFLLAAFFLIIFHASSFAVIEFGKEIDEYRSVGYQAQQEGDFNRALTFYSKATAMGGNDPWIFNNVGVIYEQMGLIDQAELNYLKALEIDPHYLPPYTNLAFLYKERGDIDRAISYFRKRIDAAPSNDEWVAVLIKELSILDPNYRMEVVDTQLEQTGQRLYEMVQEELSLNVSRADGHYREAVELLDQKQFDAAVEEIDKAMALTPDNPKLQKMRAKILYDERMFEARQKLDKAVEFLDSGDMDSARQEFQGILTILPDESIQDFE